MGKFKKEYNGLSLDGRTNRWILICQCGKRWKPKTTMLSKQYEECPKCKTSDIVDYNSDFSALVT